jgi:hypothetical protein
MVNTILLALSRLQRHAGFFRFPRSKCTGGVTRSFLIAASRQQRTTRPTMVRLVVSSPSIWNTATAACHRHPTPPHGQELDNDDRHRITSPRLQSPCVPTARRNLLPGAVAVAVGGALAVAVALAGWLRFRFSRSTMSNERRHVALLRHRLSRTTTITAMRTHQ